MAWRDEASDTGRLGEGNSALRGTDLAVEQDFGPTTIAEQQGGLVDKCNRPAGGVVPTLGWHVGMRGDEQG